MQQVKHGLLACTNEPRARPVEIDDYPENEGNGEGQDARGKDIPTSVHTERISDQHNRQQS